LARTFGDLSARTQGLVFVLLTLLVPAVAWRTCLGPERLALESRKARLAAVLAEIVRLRTSVSVQSSGERELRSLEARFAAPVEQNTPSSSRQFLAALHDAAMQSGIALSSFSGAPPPPVAAPQAARAAVKTELRRVQFDVEGGFPEFVAFLSRLVRLPQVASVPDVTIRALPRQLDRRTITATVVATTTDQNTFVIGDLPVTDDSVGKRDPFQDPIAMATMSGESPGGSDRPVRAGLASVPVGDVAVRGIARWNGAMTAILEGPDRRTFVARPKDRLLDAVIARIDERGVVFTATVTGDRSAALSEIRKNLGSNSGVRR
jgi:Tfp pilus assembly protein PilO